MASSALRWTALAVCLACAVMVQGARFPQAPAPGPSSGGNSESALFVVLARKATVAVKPDGKTGSLTLDGVNSQVTWFDDKPSRRGGQLDAGTFFGPTFLQNGKWIDQPNVAVYASNGDPGPNDDTVMTLTLASNPVFKNSTSGTVSAASLGSATSGLTGNSVTFPNVDIISTSGAQTVAGFYDTMAGKYPDGPQVLNATALTKAKTYIASNVAMFVDPYYCGCGPYGWCGCGWHSWW